MSTEPSIIEPPVRLPALFTHCKNVYGAMVEGAKMEGDVLIWTGMGTKLLTRLGLGVPYYTSVMRRLMDMDCLRQVVRGGGGQPSKWLLLREPTIDLWETFPEGTRGRYGKTGNKQQVPQQQVKDLATRVQELEANVRNLELVVYANAE